MLESWLSPQLVLEHRARCVVHCAIGVVFLETSPGGIQTLTVPAYVPIVACFGWYTVEFSGLFLPLRLLALVHAVERV